MVYFYLQHKKRTHSIEHLDASLEKEFINILLADDSEKLGEFLGSLPSPNLSLPSEGKRISILRYEPPLLCVAAFFGAEKCFQLFIDFEADLQETDSIGLTVAHFAVASGNRPIVKSIFDEHNFDIECLDENHQAPIHTAAQFGQLDIVHYLFSKNVNLASPGIKGYHPIHFAAVNGHIEVFRFLLENTPRNEINSVSTCKKMTPLLCACLGGHPEIIKLCIQHGASLRNKSSEDKTPMALAAESGNLEAVKALVENGVDFGSKKQRFVPLVQAAERGHSDIVQYLVNSQCNVNVVTFDGDTALLAAIRSKNPRTVRILLKAGAEPTLKTKKGSIFDATVDSQSCFIMKAMIQTFGPDQFLKHPKNYLIPTQAVIEKDEKFLRYLIDQKFDICYTNKNSKKYYSYWSRVHSDPKEGPLYNAISLDLFEFLKILVENGALNNPTGEHNALSWCVGFKAREMLEYLVENGALGSEPTTKFSKSAKSCIHDGRFYILQYLIEQGACVPTNFTQLAQYDNCRKYHRTSYQNKAKVRIWDLLIGRCEDGGDATRLFGILVRDSGTASIPKLLAKSPTFDFQPNDTKEIFQDIFRNRDIETMKIFLSLNPSIPEDSNFIDYFTYFTGPLFNNTDNTYELFCLAKEVGMTSPRPNEAGRNASREINFVTGIFDKKDLQMIRHLSDFGIDGTQGFLNCLNKQLPNQSVPCLLEYIRHNKLTSIHPARFYLMHSHHLIFRAIDTEEPEIVKAFIDNDQDLSVKNENGDTPLEYARSINAKQSIINLLQ